MNHAFTSGCGSTFLRSGKLAVTLRLFASGTTVSSKISPWAFSTSASVRTMPMPHTHQTGTSSVKCLLAQKHVCRCACTQNPYVQIAPRRSPNALLQWWRPRQTQSIRNTSLRRHDSNSFQTSLGNHKLSHLRKCQRKFACCIHQQRKNATEIDEINTHTCSTQRKHRPRVLHRENERFLRISNQ